MPRQEDRDVATPILRWAGGKTWLIKYLHELLPKKYKNYHEPFLGGASVFLALNPKRKSYLSDLNEELIHTYSVVKNNPERIIKALHRFVNTEEFYYYLRDKQFEDPILRAARFIYLNQTSFNGIYRVNLEGKYNVPYGFRRKDFIEAEKIRHMSCRLQNARIFKGDFSEVASRVKRNDLVFLDPPYTVSHNVNGFIKYNQKLFSLDDQFRLSELIDKIRRKNAYYILTNAAHERIRGMFEKGDQVLVKNRASQIGGTHAYRGETTEYVFTNVLN